MGESTQSVKPDHKYRCIHCEEPFDDLNDTWEHEDQNDGHKVWITIEWVNYRDQ